MRRVLLELRSGRRLEARKPHSGPWRPLYYSFEELPESGIPIESIAAATVHGLESRGIVLITPRGVILREYASPLGGRPLVTSCPCCNKQIEIRLEASDEVPGGFIVSFKKGKT